MNKTIHQFKWPLIGFLILVLATVPVWGSKYMVFFCLLFCVYLAMSQMWNLLTGFSGLFSLGQPAFIGLSGYTVAVATHHFGLSAWTSLALAGLFSALFALFMSLFIFRVRGIYYGIITLIFPESMLLLCGNWEYLRYAQGMFIKPQPPISVTAIYYVALIIGVGAVASVFLILRSNLGLGLMAMRDNEEVAKTMGVETFRFKVYCFLVSGLVTGLAGAIYYNFVVFIQPGEAFSIGWSVKFIFITIIGGIGTIEGPIVGALIYVFLSQYLAEYFSVSMIMLGVIAIAVILLTPKGIVGTFQEKIGFRILSPHRE
jgi:branched-chain amino acid transport system permease protein